MSACWSVARGPVSVDRPCDTVPVDRWMVRVALRCWRATRPRSLLSQRLSNGKRDLQERGPVRGYKRSGPGRKGQTVRTRWRTTDRRACWRADRKILTPGMAVAVAVAACNLSALDRPGGRCPQSWSHLFLTATDVCPPAPSTSRHSIGDGTGRARPPLSPRDSPSPVRSRNTVDGLRWAGGGLALAGRPTLECTKKEDSLPRWRRSALSTSCL